jgi:hypothetical protein
VHTQSTINDNSHPFQINTSPSYTTVPYSYDESTGNDFSLELSYSPTTPSTSGYITPAPSDKTDPVLLLDSQAASEAWMQNPGTHEYFPWGTDAIYSSFSSEMMISDSTIAWSTWYDTDQGQVPYITPGMFQYHSDPSTGDPQYSLPSPAST